MRIESGGSNNEGKKPEASYKRIIKEEIFSRKGLDNIKYGGIFGSTYDAADGFLSDNTPKGVTGSIIAGAFVGWKFYDAWKDNKKNTEKK